MRNSQETGRQQEAIYRGRVRQLMQVATTQIDLLNHYDLEGREVRVEQLHSSSRQAIITNPSEQALDRMIGVIKEFQTTIDEYRMEHSEAKESDTPQKKYEELRGLMRIYNLL